MGQLVMHLKYRKEVVWAAPYTLAYKREIKLVGYRAVNTQKDEGFCKNPIKIEVMHLK